MSQDQFNSMQKNGMLGYRSMMGQQQSVAEPPIQKQNPNAVPNQGMNFYQQQYYQQQLRAQQYQNPMTANNNKDQQPSSYYQQPGQQYPTMQQQPQQYGQYQMQQQQQQQYGHFQGNVNKTQQSQQQQQQLYMQYQRQQNTNNTFQPGQWNPYNNNNGNNMQMYQPRPYTQTNPQQQQLQRYPMPRPNMVPMYGVGGGGQRPSPIMAANPMLSMQKRSKLCRWNAPVTQDAINEFYSRFDSLKDQMMPAIRYSSRLNIHNPQQQQQQTQARHIINNNSNNIVSSSLLPSTSSSTNSTNNNNSHQQQQSLLKNNENQIKKNNENTGIFGIAKNHNIQLQQQHHQQQQLYNDQNPNTEITYSAESFILSHSQGKQWPPSLGRFVQKTFSKCISQQDRIEANQYLKSIVNQPFEKLNSIQWDLESIPTLKRQEQLKQVSQNKFQKLLNDEAAKRQQKVCVLSNHVVVQYASGQVFNKEQEIKKRKERFNVQQTKPKQSGFDYTSNNLQVDDEEVEIQAMGKVVGTSKSLEKQYLRLTGPPKPETIRPLPVLRKSLEMLKARWIERGGPDDYEYISEQLRSIRQDIMVQGIRQEFSVEVYETHARFALEAGDLDHFNQCQSILKGLHRSIGSKNKMEFVGYSVLYQFLRDIKLQIPSYLKGLDQDQRRHPYVKHAFEVHRALNSQNYIRFFKLQKQAPNLGSKLMKVFNPRIRARILQSVAKCYQMGIETSELMKLTQFQTQQELIKFVKHEGGIFKQDGKTLNTKQSLPNFMKSPTLAQRF